MKVLVIGSWIAHAMEDPGKERFDSACGEIGAALAGRGHEVIVSSQALHTADAHVVLGMKNSGHPSRVTIVRPMDGKRPFSQETGLDVKYHLLDGDFSDCHRKALGMADALVVIGGRHNALRAGLVTAAVAMPRIPLQQFGGNGRLLYEAFRLDSMWGETVGNPTFLRDTSWKGRYAKDLVGLLERLHRSPRVAHHRFEELPAVSCERLLEKASLLETELDEITGFFQRAIQFEKVHPHCSLNSIRTIEERLVLSHYRMVTGKEPKSTLLGHLLSLEEYKSKIDWHVFARMWYLKDLGNLGSHGGEISAVDTAEALRCLGFLLDWYLGESSKRLRDSS